MHRYGFVKVAAATPIIKVADCHYNKTEIINMINEGIKNNSEIILFPELSISGYTCGDLFFQDILLKEVENSIIEICEHSLNYDVFIVIGAPIRIKNKIYNCAVAINKGKILGIIPKSYLPNYNEFYEERWFASALGLMKNCKINYCGQDVLFGTNILFKHSNFEELSIGIEICEDLWAPIPPSSYHCQYGATLILNPSASNDLVGKSEYRKSLVEQQSARCITGYVYCSSGFGESTTDVVYGGHSLISENGNVIKEKERFNYSNSVVYSDIDISKITYERTKINSFNNHVDPREYDVIEFDTDSNDYTLCRKIYAHPFVPANIEHRNRRCEEIFNIQTMGLAKRISHIRTSKLIIGISGGLDSTLALLVCVKTCDKLNISRDNITAVTMPGFGTTDRTYSNAIDLMKNLQVNIKEIPINKAVTQHFIDINHDLDNHDITYENTQARERTQILMDIANQENGIVVGTGDLSEIALGWATYNGDHMSMYAVNIGIPKTLVRYLVKWIADNNIDENAKDTLYDVLDTPVSPELLPPDENGDIRQKTEEVVGPYELHDFFLFYVVRFGHTPKKIYYLACHAFKDKYDNNTILKWLRNFYRRFFSQQFKRSCIPDGPKVGSICLSPRGDWRMPSDSSCDLWLKDLENIVIE
ncbi:MAG: NAD(+) synthase [Eubacteriaceae bacterium]